MSDIKRYNIVPVKNTVAQDHGVITAEINMREVEHGAWIKYEDVEAEIERLREIIAKDRRDIHTQRSVIAGVNRENYELRQKNDKLQAVVDEADYLSAEVMDAWANSCLSIDTIDANDAYQKARAALEGA